MLHFTKMQLLDFILLQRVINIQKFPLSHLVTDFEQTNKQQKFNKLTHEERKKHFYTIFSHWTEFYGEELEEPNYNNYTYCQQETCENKTSINLIEKNAWISNCYFLNMSSPSNGAAIHDESTNNLLIEECTFDRCKISGQNRGGAIYVHSSNCVLHKVCGVSCESSYISSFSYIGQESSKQTNNTVYDSSVAYCNAVSYYAMYHSFGYIDIKSVNLSHNKAKSSYPALYSQPSSTNGGKYGTSISYSSFSNNSAQNRCIYFGYKSSSANQYEINYSNIIRNPTKNTIYAASGALEMRECTILENTSPAFDGSITLIKCTVSEGQIEDDSDVNINETTNSFIYGLTFISTADCVNIFDTFEGVSLTGIIEDDKSKCHTWYLCEELKQNLPNDVVKFPKFISLLCCFLYQE